MMDPGKHSFTPKKGKTSVVMFVGLQYCKYHKLIHAHMEVYWRWHRLTVFKAHSAELPRDEPIKVLARLERENNKMQRQLNCFYVIQKDRKHLQEKAQEQAIKPINEITR